MDRNSVWRILHGYIQPPKGTDLALEIEDWRAGLGTAADAIARTHEEEMSEAEHHYRQANMVDSDIVGMARIDMIKAQDEIAQLRAQVAKLAGGLDDMLVEIQNYRWQPDAYDRDGTMILLEQMAEVALTSTPQVAHHLKGTLFEEGVDYGPRGEGNYGDMITIPKQQIEMRVEVFSDIKRKKEAYLQLHRKYYEVEVIVLKCSAEAADSEQEG